MNAFVGTVPAHKIARFCQRWKIHELALFGSILREDFSPHSDIDVLATFAADSNWGLLEHIQIQNELEHLFKRKVDLMSRRGLDRSRNWVLRSEILESAEILYPKS